MSAVESGEFGFKPRAQAAASTPKRAKESEHKGFHGLFEFQTAVIELLSQAN